MKKLLASRLIIHYNRRLQHLTVLTNSRIGSASGSQADFDHVGVCIPFDQEGKANRSSAAP
ncbi:MAG: hypothetical protein ABW007_20630, partial [Chitinophagaceae bacterium]